MRMKEPLGTIHSLYALFFDLSKRIHHCAGAGERWGNSCDLNSNELPPATDRCDPCGVAQNHFASISRRAAMPATCGRIAEHPPRSHLQGQGKCFLEQLIQLIFGKRGVRAGGRVGCKADAGGYSFELTY